MPEVVVTRRTTLDAAHRLHDSVLSSEENRARFGPFGNVDGHGHSYRLDVAPAGGVDPVSGNGIGLTRLRDVVAQHLTRRLDHPNPNLDAAFLRGVQSCRGKPGRRLSARARAGAGTRAAGPPAPLGNGE